MNGVRRGGLLLKVRAAVATNQIKLSLRNSSVSTNLVLWLTFDWPSTLLWIVPQPDSQELFGLCIAIERIVLHVFGNPRVLCVSGISRVFRMLGSSSKQLWVPATACEWFKALTWALTPQDCLVCWMDMYFNRMLHEYHPRRTEIGTNSDLASHITKRFASATGASIASLTG